MYKLAKCKGASSSRGARARSTSVPAPSAGNQALLRRRQTAPATGPQTPDGNTSTAIRQAATNGVLGAGTMLPHFDRIQSSFGRHDLSAVRAHDDAAASNAARSIGAAAYTFGEHTAFDGPPDVFTAAHEAAHVVQQRHGIDVPHGVGRSGDEFESHADAVASRVVTGALAEDLLDKPAFWGSPSRSAPRPALQRQEKKPDAGAADAKDAAMTQEVASVIDAGLAKIDENFIKGTTNIQLAIRNDPAFLRAWQDYCDRSGHSGAPMGDIGGFVDPTHPNGKMGFVRASKGIGTAIHEAMHLRADPGFFGGQVGNRVVGINMNEGTTELFTRIVIAYAGSNIERNNYEPEKTAMLRLQGICGLSALAQWYFHNDHAAVEKAVGQKLDQFMMWMDSADVRLDKAARAESAINSL